MASTYLSRTAGTSTENYKYTFSAWVKRTGVLGSSSVNEVLFSNWNDSSNSAYIRFEDADDNLQVYDKYGSTVDLNYQTNMKFRDCNAWYHIVVNVDGTRSAGERCKIYVNGTEVSCSSTTDTGGTLAMKTVTTTNAMRLGAIDNTGGTEYYFSGLMSHVHYIDGTGYDASYFGETDSTTGEWKIKTNVTGVTYGNNGFFILKDGNSVTDQSGNSNNFTVGGGTLTKTEDNPSDVFNTCNPLYQRPTNKTMGFLYGNTEVWVGTGASDKACGSTMAVSKGKFYWEQKIIANDGAGTNASLVGGLFSVDDFGGESPGSYGAADTCGMAQNGNAWKDTTDLGNFTTAPVGGDIFGIAFDADNGTVKFWRDGVALNSGNAIITGLDTSKTWMPYFVAHSGTGNARTINNFGNGYFQTAAITSEGTNASNIGKFEYDVPTGYTALSTKGLNN